MRNILIALFFLPLISTTLHSQITIESTELAPGIHRLFVNNAVAVVVFHGDEGILVVDAAYEHTAEKLMKEIQRIGEVPIRYLINTHLHGDHTGGNKVIGRDADIVAHESVKAFLSVEQQRGENVIPAFPEYALPNILVEGHKEMSFNQQKIQITHMPGGHTRGDLIVYFTQANVLVMGDLLFAGFFPFVDVHNGGNPFRFLENVKEIMDHYPEDVIIVGGHGPVYTMEELHQWHRDLEETIALMRSAKGEGMSQEEMKEKRILKQWASMGSFFITEDRWIDTMYPFL